MPAIFISHSSRDQALANDITSSLKGLGYEEVFLDFDTETGIGAGEDWEKTLYQKLSRCHALILILTPNWLASTWCRIELAQARALGKTILPIICQPLGERYVLPEIQAVDFIDWKSGGLERIEQRLRAITSELARGFKFDPHRLPYPGIHAFETDDAAIYFGRDDEVRAVIQKLDAHRAQGVARLLLIVGASGSGKSSLLKAGVLPQLTRRRREWIVLPPIRPEKTPMEMLAKSIAEHLGEPEKWRPQLDRLGQEDVIKYIKELIKDFRTGDAKNATVLLPIDQFEEIFSVTSTDESKAVVRLLAGVLAPESNIPLMVLANGRSDVLEGLIEAGDLAQLTDSYPVPLMSVSRVPRLVEGPATVAGFNVDKGLAERMAADVESAEALPLLAYTLWLLYRKGVDSKRLSLPEYESLGDAERKLNPIQNSVRLVADQAIGGSNPSEQSLAALRDAFVPHLVRVRLDDGKRVRQPARLSEIPSGGHQIIQTLTDARLLITRAAEPSERATDGGNRIIEVAHEALFKAWPTLDKLLTEEQAFLLDIERIRSAYEIWRQAPEQQKNAALLQGLQLSRARDWLMKYPKRFVSREIEPLRAFIAASADAADAARQRDEQQAAKTRQMELWLFRGAIAAAFIFAAAAAFAGWQYFQAEQARATANNQRKIAVAREIFAISQVEGDVNSECSLDLAVAAYDAAQLASGVDPLPFETAVRSALARSRVERTMALDVSPHKTPSWRSDGSEFSVVDSAGKVWLWTKGSDAPRLLNIPNAVLSAEWLSGGAQLLTLGESGLETWDTVSGQLTKSVPVEGDAWEALRLDPAGQRALIWSVRTGTALLDVTTGKVQLLAPQTNVWRGHAWSPDGKQFAVGTVNGEVWIATLADQKYFALKHPEEITSVAWSPDGKVVVVGLDSGRIWLWDPITRRHQDTLDGHSNQVMALDFSPDGKKLVSASWDHSIRIWLTQSWRSPERLTSHTAGVHTVRWSPTDDQISSTGADNTVRLWSAKTSQEPQTWLETPGWVWSVGWNAGGTSLVATTNSEVAVRDSAGHVRRVATPSGHFNGGAWAGSASVYAFVDDERVVVMDGTTWSVIMEKPTNVRRTLGVAITPDGSLVAVSSTTDIMVLSVPSGEIRYRIRAISPALAFSPDGKLLAFAAAGTPTITLVDSASGKASQSLTGNDPGKATWALDWSRDGRSLAAGSDDTNVRVWTLSSPENPKLLRGHGGDVKGVAWNTSGDRLATASLDDTARIWMMPSGQLLAVLPGHTSGLRNVAWSTNSTMLATAAEDGTARLFHANFGEVLAMARRQQKVGLTAAEYQQCTGRIARDKAPGEQPLLTDR